MKKATPIFLITLILTVCSTTFVYSQGGFSMHAGPSFPISDFAGDDWDDEDEAGAGVGINVGLLYTYTFSESGFGLFTGLDFIHNSLQKDVKDEWEDTYDEDDVNVNITFPKFINIPFSAGLNFTHQADDKVALFANTGIVLNYFKITDDEVDGNLFEARSEYEWSNNFGFRLGGGICLNNSVTFSIDYFTMGEHDIDGEFEVETEWNEFDGDVDFELEVDIVTITVGVKF